jgi:hypothetical protein
VKAGTVSEVHKMIVSIDDPRHHRAPAQIDGSRR